MSVKIRIISALLLCALLFSLSACAVKIDPPRDMTAEQEAYNMGFYAADYNGRIEVGGYEFLKVNIKLDYQDEVKWSTNNPAVAVVDSNGRVDGVKAGKATITAHAKSAVIDYDIEVVKAGKTAVSYSTAFTGNDEHVEVNKMIGGSKNLYAIIINEYNCTVTVFTYDINSKEQYYNKAVRTMACSTGERPLTKKNDKKTWISNEITEKSEWVLLSDDKYYRYASYIGEELMFQSSPYKSQDESTLIVEEYNKIGTHATAKNIRLSVADAKWIYDNCPEGTEIRIINSDDQSVYYPLGVPNSMKLTENSKSLKYDPTDNSKENPYNKLKPVISGAEYVAVEVGKGLDLLQGVTAVDTCGNDITSKINTDGTVNVNKEGKYVVSYYVTDDMNRTARVDREIIVTDNIEAFTTASAE